MQGARKENKTNAQWAIQHVLCWLHGAAKQQQVTEVVSCLMSHKHSLQQQGMGRLHAHMGG